MEWLTFTHTHTHTHTCTHNTHITHTHTHTCTHNTQHITHTHNTHNTHTHTHTHTHTVLLPPLTTEIKLSLANAFEEDRLSSPSQPPHQPSQGSVPSHISQGHTPHKGHTHHHKGSAMTAPPPKEGVELHTSDSGSTRREEGRVVGPQLGQQMSVTTARGDGGVSSDSPIGSSDHGDGSAVGSPPTPPLSGITRHTGSQADLFHTPKSSPPTTPHPSPPPTPQLPPTVGSIVGCCPRVGGIQTFFSGVSHKYAVGGSAFLWHVCKTTCGVGWHVYYNMCTG